MPKKQPTRRTKKSKRNLSLSQKLRLKLGKYFYPALGMLTLFIVVGAGLFVYSQSRADAGLGNLPDYKSRLNCGANTVPATGGRCVPRPTHPGCPADKIPVNGGGCVPRPAGNFKPKPSAGKSAGEAAAESLGAAGARAYRDGKRAAIRDSAEGGGPRTGTVQPSIQPPVSNTVSQIDNVPGVVPLANPDGDIRVVTYLDDPSVKGDENKRIGGVAITVTQNGEKPSCATHKTGKAKTNSKGYITRKGDKEKILVKGTVNFIGCDVGSYKVTMQGRKGYKIKGTSVTENVSVNDNKTTEVKFVLQKVDTKATKTSGSAGGGVLQCEKRKQYALGFQADLAQFKKNHYDMPTDLTPYPAKQVTNVAGQKVPGRSASGAVQVFKDGKPATANKTNYALVLDVHRANREMAEKRNVNTTAYNSAIVKMREEIERSSNVLVAKFNEWGNANPAAIDCATPEGKARALELSKKRSSDIKTMNADLKKVQTKSKEASTQFSKTKSAYTRAQRGR